MALPLLVLQQDLKHQWRDVADSSTFSTQHCWPILRIHRFCKQKSCVCVCVDGCTHTHTHTHTHTQHTLFTTAFCFEISSAHLRSNKDLERREEKNYCWRTTARSVRFVYCPYNNERRFLHIYVHLHLYPFVLSQFEYLPTMVIYFSSKTFKNIKVRSLGDYI